MGSEIGIRNWDWKLGLKIGIGNWNLEIRIWIGNWEVWHCGNYGIVEIWNSGNLELWKFGGVDIWTFGKVEIGIVQIRIRKHWDMGIWCLVLELEMYILFGDNDIQTKKSLLNRVGGTLSKKLDRLGNYYSQNWN